MRRFIMLLIILVILIGMTIIIAKLFDFSTIPNYFISLQFGEPVEVNPVYKSIANVDLYSDGLSFPTSMAFVDNNTLLVLEKDKGYVRLISDGMLHPDPIFKIHNISNQKEQGLLGIAVLKKSETNATYDSNENYHSISTTLTEISSSTDEHAHENSGYLVYLYFTEKLFDSNNHMSSEGNNSNNTLRNRIYEYTWNGIDSLSDPRLVMDMPAGPGSFHNGGKMKIDSKGNLYAVIGDLTTINNTLQNYPGGSNQSISIPNNSSVIIRVDPLIKSSIPNDNPFFEYYNKDKNFHLLGYYYAYGIRNSFGIDLDPITGRLWDTENGEDMYDEINLVEPGFNSGWYKVMGPLERNNDSDTSDLVELNGSHYSDPEFSWRIPIGITDIEFLDSSKLGNDLKNNMFVGDVNNGNLYFFELNSNRTGIDMDKTISGQNNGKKLQDLVADDQVESEKIIFAKGFDGRITDIETGPDGNLYILTYFDGRIYKIS